MQNAVHDQVGVMGLYVLLFCSRASAATTGRTQHQIGGHYRLLGVVKRQVRWWRNPFCGNRGSRFGLRSLVDHPHGDFAVARQSVANPARNLVARQCCPVRGRIGQRAELQREGEFRQHGQQALRDWLESGGLSLQLRRYDALPLGARAPGVRVLGRPTRGNSATGSGMPISGKFVQLGRHRRRRPRGQPRGGARCQHWSAG
jgi:hypothetical protein